MKPPGSIVRLTVDWEPETGAPYEGDLVKTATGRNAYHLLNVRRVNSTVHPRRYRVTAVKVDPDEVDDPDWTLHWWPRS